MVHTQTSSLERRKLSIFFRSRKKFVCRLYSPFQLSKCFLPLWSSFFLLSMCPFFFSLVSFFPYVLQSSSLFLPYVSSFPSFLPSFLVSYLPFFLAFLHYLFLSIILSFFVPYQSFTFSLLLSLPFRLSS